MAARYLSYETTVDQLHDENTFTIAACVAHPLGAPHLAKFEAMTARIGALRDMLLALRAAVVIARAKIYYWDGLLNADVDALENTLLLLNSDRSAPLYQLFFRKNPPSLVKKPLLGPQLEEMRGWLTTLLGPNAPGGLGELGERISAHVEGADAALAEKRSAADALKLFYFSDQRRLIDDYNRLRVETFGALDALPLAPEHRALNLGRGFAKSFFIQGRGNYKGAPALAAELAEAEEELAEKRRAVAALESRVAGLFARKAAADRAAEERQTKAARVAELERELTALKAEIEKA
jgi:hypothetical protein